jgi:pyruvate-formate lyase
MVWNTFDANRNHLLLQYHDICWDENSGWDIEKLENEALYLEQSMAGQARIRVRAAIFELILKHGRINIDPLDWFQDRLQHGNILIQLRDRWQKEIKESVFPDLTKYCELAESCCAFFASSPDFSHTSPDWERLLKMGPSGLLDNIRDTRKKKSDAGCLSESEKDFYDSAEIVYMAVLHFINRLADCVEKMASMHAEEQERMRMSAKCLRNIAKNPPGNLYEALQLSYIFHELMEMEGELVRSMGGFDRLYYSYYINDIERGIFTKEQVKELIKFFYVKFFAKTDGKFYGKNIFFGGVDSNGLDVVNSLSYLALEAYEELNLVDPKLSIRVHEKSPLTFLEVVLNCIRRGRNSIVFVNDDVVIPALVKRGIPLEEARIYTVIGCYEPAIMGKELSCSAAIYVNIAKAVELAIFNGKDPLTGRQIGPYTGECSTFSSFDDYFQAFKEQLKHMLEAAMDATASYEAYWPQMNTSPLLSGTMLECVENGRDISAGGAKYNNTGCCCACFASAIDSLIAVRKLVFEEKVFTMEKLAEVLKDNWKGYELQRLKVLHNGAKWGNDLPEPDNMGCITAKYMADIINGRPNGRGGRYIAALFSIDFNHKFGSATGALPDGRRAGEPLSKNLCAVTGMDREGVTALIKSVTKLDFSIFPDGSVLDVMLHPSAVKGESGIDALIGLIQTYFARGGAAIQFNIFDSKELREAQKHPEKYSNLQVRVCGWNAYFVNLSVAEQNEIIKQAEGLV